MRTSGLLRLLLLLLRCLLLSCCWLLVGGRERSQTGKQEPSRCCCIHQADSQLCRVCVRIRPENDTEKTGEYKEVVQVLDEQMLVFDPKVSKHCGVLLCHPVCCCRFILNRAGPQSCLVTYTHVHTHNATCVHKHGLRTHVLFCSNVQTDNAPSFIGQARRRNPRFLQKRAR